MENFISTNIAYLLNKEKTTQDEFGAIFELKKGVINQYLLKKSNPKIETIVKICDHYNLTLDQFVRTSLEEESYKPKEEKPIVVKEPPPGYGFISLKYVETLEKALEDKNKIIKLYEEKLK
jgi:transcriptional regulator with XRE-family HTH domain